MGTLAQDFEQFHESTHQNIVEEYLYNKPFVKEIISLIGDHYKLSLYLDKEEATVFIRYLNVSGQVISYESSNSNQPITILSIYIPEKETTKLLKELDITFQRVIDFLAYKRFQKDKQSIAPFHLAYLFQNDQENDYSLQ